MRGVTGATVEALVPVATCPANLAGKMARKVADDCPKARCLRSRRSCALFVSRLCAACIDIAGWRISKPRCASADRAGNRGRAEARRPMGLAVEGGLVVSQLLPLAITPVAYIYPEPV